MRPVLSVVVRRFPREFADDVENSIKRIQQAVADQPGFTGLQNRFTLKKNDCELVTIITFDTQTNLEKWEMSPIRESYVKELDKLSQDLATNTQFAGLALLVPPAARVGKGETVVILIIWILILSTLLRYPADALLPENLAPFWRNAIQTSVIVVLISYIFLPFTSGKLVKLKSHLRRVGKS